MALTQLSLKTKYKDSLGVNGAVSHIIQEIRLYYHEI